MGRIIPPLCLALFAVISPLPNMAHGEGQLLYVHFFKSAVCPHCRLAESELPGMLKRFPRIRLMSYEILNAKSQADAANRQNKMKLIAMMSEINARLGGKPFIYEYRTPYAFVMVNGVPYYQKIISESTTIKKEVPVPVFILGDRVYVGYQPRALDQAFEAYSSGR